MITDGSQRIDPGQAPDGLVFRITRGDDRVVVCFEPVPNMDVLDDDDMRRMTERHQRIAYDTVETGGAAIMEIFDGDTGECTGAVVVLSVDDLA